MMFLNLGVHYTPIVTHCNDHNDRCKDGITCYIGQIPQLCSDFTDILCDIRPLINILHKLFGDRICSILTVVKSIDLYGERSPVSHSDSELIYVVNIKYRYLHCPFYVPGITNSRVSCPAMLIVAADILRIILNCMR